MTLHEQMLADLDVLLAADDFAEVHVLDGVSVLAVIDLDVSLPRKGISLASSNEWQGLADADILLALKSSELSLRPVVGQQMTLDERTVFVANSIEEDGLLVLTLRRIDDSQQLSTATVTHYEIGDGWTAPEASGVESGIPCRFQLEEREVMTPGGLLVQSKGHFSFGLHSGLAALSVGDEIVLTDGADTWRVIAMHEERDLAGEIAQRMAWVVRN